MEPLAKGNAIAIGTVAEYDIEEFTQYPGVGSWELVRMSAGLQCRKLLELIPDLIFEVGDDAGVFLGYLHLDCLGE